MKRLLILLACAAGSQAQAPIFKPPPDALAPETAAPANLGFETGAPGKLPDQWALAQESRIAGYAVEVTRTGCHSGRSCAVITAGPRVEKGNVAALVQPFSGVPYRGKQMRLRAWVRLEEGGRADRIRVAFTADGEKKARAYVQKRSVKAEEWTLAEVQGRVPADADQISIMISMTGLGKAWIDDVTFEPSK